MYAAYCILHIAYCMAVCGAGGGLSAGWQAAKAQAQGQGNSPVHHPGVLRRAAPRHVAARRHAGHVGVRCSTLTFLCRLAAFVGTCRVRIDLLAWVGCLCLVVGVCIPQDDLVGAAGLHAHSAAVCWNEFDTGFFNLWQSSMQMFCAYERGHALNLPSFPLLPTHNPPSFPSLTDMHTVHIPLICHLSISRWATQVLQQRTILVLWTLPFPQLAGEC